LEFLTCAVDSISFKSSVACTYKATNHICTGGIHMAVVSVQFTLIDVCTETNEQSLISDREKHRLCMYITPSAYLCQ